MNTIDVRIVKLEAMRVASAYGFGKTPELIAHQKMLAYVRSKGLFDREENYHSYGFNNPNPSEGSPNYGYEVWVQVQPDIQPEGDIKIKDVPGGLYAVTRFQGISKIGQVWQDLVAWREDSRFKKAHHQWLEDLHNPSETDPENYVFDLYLPIRE